MKVAKTLLVSAFVTTGLILPASANTITVITKGASADGSVFLSQSNDTYTGDPSIVYVKDKKFKEGSMRNVYPSALVYGEFPEYECFNYPRLNAPERADGYQYDDCVKTKPVGQIKEVSKTNAYLDGDYGIINDKGLMIGTSFAYLKNFREVKPSDNKGIFNPQELGRLALERCDNAKDAVKLIGSTIDNYGIYGGPAVICLADKTDAYVMEMVPLNDRTGGLWVARKIEDGKVFVSADSFRIGSIEKDSDDFIYSDRLFSLLDELKLTKKDKKGNVNWMRSVGATEKRPYYSLRRIWRVFSLVAPSKKFSAWVKSFEDNDYPFALTPDTAVSIEKLMEIHKDTYRGTEFDPSDTATGGFFASPYSYHLDDERTISTARTIYTYINQLRDDLPVPLSWMAVNTPAESTFIPLTVSPLPDCYSHVNRTSYDPEKFYWAANMVSTLTKGYYYTMIDTVKLKAIELEQRSVSFVNKYAKLSKKDFTSLLNANAIGSISDWQRLYEVLLEKHDNGFKLRYAQGHNPKFTPVVKYRKELNVKEIAHD
ncbi:MAG: C69 family dipeptidase [Succinivibrio sp.]